MTDLVHVTLKGRRGSLAFPLPRNSLLVLHLADVVNARQCVIPNEGGWAEGVRNLGGGADRFTIPPPRFLPSHPTAHAGRNDTRHILRQTPEFLPSRSSQRDVTRLGMTIGASRQTLSSGETRASGRGGPRVTSPVLYPLSSVPLPPIDSAPCRADIGLE